MAPSLTPSATCSAFAGLCGQPARVLEADTGDAYCGGCHDALLAMLPPNALADFEPLLCPWQPQPSPVEQTRALAAERDFWRAEAARCAGRIPRVETMAGRLQLQRQQYRAEHNADLCAALLLRGFTQLV